MLTNLGYTYDGQMERIVTPLPMSAVYNKQHFISQFITLHQKSTQPILVSQLLTSELPIVFAEYWIVYDDFNRPIACAGANTVMSDVSVGYVGLFEAKDQHAGTAVLRAATEWLRRGGVRQFEPVRQVLGPVNLTTWLQYRLRVDDEPSLSMSYEPRHPAFYQECFTQAGYHKAVDYYTTFFDIDQMIEGFERNTKGANLGHYGLAMQSWNSLDFAASLTPERHPCIPAEDNVSKRIYDLSIKLFHGKELFDEGLSRENHRQVVLNDMISRPEVDNASLLDLSTFIFDSSTGEDIGYLACWMESQTTLVLKTVGFLPQVHKTKVYSISVLETIRRAKDVWGCTRVACALMNENTASISEHLGGKSVRHTYRLYIYQPQTIVTDHRQEGTTMETAMKVHTTISYPPTVSPMSPSAEHSALNGAQRHKQQCSQALAPRSQERLMSRL
ncbi:hypothetical protein BG004_005251 [Podila humilis]|nr:hypothetical protein BG004_005251 [Podila humilis]